MKKAKKTFLAVACAGALVVGSVAATMAYLTATTDAVTNTFTVGNVSFDETIGNGLDEADVNEYGQLEYVASEEPDGDPVVAPRVTSNKYKLVSGHNYTKDPTVHMGTNSEDAWLFVTVDNGIASVEAAGTTSIASQMAVKGWTLVGGYTNLYQYGSAAVSADADITVFDSFTVSSAATKTDLDGVADAKIVIKACAVQADGLSQAAAAAEAANQLSATKAPVTPTPGE